MPRAILIRQRKHHSKSRTGCWTCKKRRVKCDETKPICERCSKGGWVCISAEQEGRMCKVQPTVLGNMTLGLFKTREEYRYFDFFRTQTVFDLSGWFKSRFWRELVLNIAHNNEVVRHAAIALGVLHLEASDNWEPSERALRLYGLSLSHLRAYLARGHSQHSHVYLTTCLLLSLFDVSRYQFRAAQMHCAFFMQTLETWRHINEDSLEGQALPFYENNLLDHFTTVRMRINLDLRAITTPGLNGVHGGLSSIVIPQKFSGVEEAKSIFEQLKVTAFKVQQAAAGGFQPAKMWHLPDIRLFIPEYKPAEPFTTIIREFRRRLTQWNEAFEGFMEESSAYLKAEDLRQAYALRFLHSILAIALERDPILGERCYDPFVMKFNDAISHALMAVDIHYSLRPTAKRPMQMLAVGTGVLYCLCFTAVRCRHRIVRYRALEALSRAPYRECIWDSFIAHRVGRFLVEYEEKQRHPATVGPEGIAPNDRITNLDIAYLPKDKIQLLVVDIEVGGRKERHSISLDKETEYVSELLVTDYGHINGEVIE